MQQPTLPADVVALPETLTKFREHALKGNYALAQRYHEQQGTAAIESLVAGIGGDDSRRAKWTGFATELDAELKIVKDIVKELARTASLAGSSGPTEERQSSGGVAFTAGEPGDLAVRVSSREKHNQHLQHHSRGSIIDGHNRQNIGGAVDRLDLGLGSLAIDPDGPVATNDPDVWPPPTPDPSRGGAVLHQAAAAAGGGPASGLSPGPRFGGGVASSKLVRREVAAAALASDKARQQLPAWARAATPAAAGNGFRAGAARERRGSGGGGAGGGGGLPRKDSVVRGRMVMGGAGGAGGGGGGQMGNRRNSRDQVKVDPKARRESKDTGVAGAGPRRRRSSFGGGVGGGESRVASGVDPARAAGGGSRRQQQQHGAGAAAPTSAGRAEGREGRRGWAPEAKRQGSPPA
ncbi:unnamed protein product, partial [Ectocarpus sp. 13 AM-2016]